ncbi:MAG: hypothetical protein ACXVKA_15295 [Acidimicrobiia bacterium]
MARSKVSKQSSAIFTLAGTVITALVSIAVKGTSAGLSVVLIVVAAVLLVFAGVLWYQVFTDRRGSSQKSQANLDPDRFVDSLTGEQRLILELALKGAVDDVANTVGMKPDLVRSNLFARIPKTERLRMVKGAHHHMNDPRECTLEMDIGTGASGRAFGTGEVVRAIWKEGWGQNDIGEDEQLAKLNPGLRWILSVPVRDTEMRPALVLSVDGLNQTPTTTKLADALSHLPRFGEGISKTFLA